MVSKGTRVETIVYSDSDHAGDYVDRKSTSDVCTFMGCCLTSWCSKKQTALAILTTEAEYVSAEKACQQALWMKQALVDYDINLNDIPVLCDNKGAIGLSKTLILHSRIKHIEICDHFLCDNVQKGNISIEKSVVTELVDLIEAHNNLNPISIPKCDDSLRVNYRVVVLVFKARGIPLRFGEIELSLVAFNPELEVFYALSDNQVSGL
nr:copia protein [Tanacetum cinerariifolium]